MKKPILPILATILICVNGISCATGAADTKGGTPTTDEGPKHAAISSLGAADNMKGQEATDYREIQTLYSQGAYETALFRMGAFEKKYPNSKQLVQIRNLRGLAYLLTKRPAQAIYHFQRALSSSTNPSHRQFLLYNLAVAQYEAGQLEDMQETVAQIDPSSLDKASRVKFHSLRSTLYQKKGSPAAAARELLTIGKLLEGDPAREFAPQLDRILKDVNDTTTLERLYADHEETALADSVLFRLGAREFEMGQAGAGEAHLRALMEKFPQSPHYLAAREMLSSTRAQAPVDKNVIGILIPMKGKFAPYGASALQAIELAFDIFEGREGGPGVSLVIEDAGDDADSALKALDRLYYKHHAIGVIGPMLSKGIDQVTRRAQQLGLPLLTLSQQPGVPGDYVFQSGLTLGLQARALARYAIDKLGLKKFAIVHPRDKFGEQYSAMYWDAVESLGGEVVGIEAYTPGETDFRQAVDRLAGTFYADARQRELDELARLRTENKITKRNRKTEHFYALKPIVDFDAVFIPDDTKVAGQLMPTFAYRDVDGVKFLGTSTWNSPDFVNRLQNFAEGAIFVDAFFAESQSPVVRNFVTRYTETFNQAPGAIEALAYDGATLMRAIVQREKPQTRADLKSALQNVAGHVGVTGRIVYKDGMMARDLTVLTVQQGKITEAAH